MHKKFTYINRLAAPAVAALGLSMLPGCSTTTEKPPSCAATTRKQMKSVLDATKKKDMSSEAASVSKEKTKKFEGLSESQKRILWNHGAISINVEETPEGHKASALQFESDAAVTVERSGRVRVSGEAYVKIPNQAVLYITHYDTASVEVRKREITRYPDIILVTVRVNNTDGSATFITIETDKNMADKLTTQEQPVAQP